MKNLWQRARLAYPIIVILAGLGYIYYAGSDMLKNQIEVLSWKLVMVGVATVLAHLVRQQVFYYVDISEILKEKTQASAITFLAIAVIYGAIILAVCAGL